MHTYYDVKDMLKKELDEIVMKGELSAGGLDTIDKLLNSIKNSCKIIMYEEYAGDGYSYADFDADMSKYSYARTRDNRGRYSTTRGRYSRTATGSEKEEKLNMLREMMNEASSEEERRMLHKIVRRMENE